MATVRSFLYRGAESPCCPLWGWCSAQRIKIVMIAGGNHTSVSCRDSGKGGVVSNFEMLPFNEPHPLSQPVRAASSPIGEPSFPCCPRWGKCRAAAKGVLLVTLSCYHSSDDTPSVRPFGLPAPPLGRRVSLLPPLGEVPRSGKGGVVSNFEMLPFNEQHPLSQPVRAASSPIGEPRNCAYSPGIS